MKLCRFTLQDGHPRIGLVQPDRAIRDLTAAGITSLTSLIEADHGPSQVQRVARDNPPVYATDQVRWLAPVEKQEVWAAGVTYLRSKKARMEESDFSATAYDKVYEAARPEIFFKALAEKVSGPGEPVGIRKDARWNVPEPELTLAINSKGRVAGYTIGNDMSSRDIEGENLLYLPQAKVYDRSCAIGPCVVLHTPESEARTWTIRLEIQRAGRTAFAGETSAGQIKRGFDELADYLFRSQTFPHGALLLTGTGVVPPEDFTLQPGDLVQIDISGIGRLTNPVAQV